MLPDPFSVCSISSGDLCSFLILAICVLCFYHEQSSNGFVEILNKDLLIPLILVSLIFLYYFCLLLHWLLLWSLLFSSFCIILNLIYLFLFQLLKSVNQGINWRPFSSPSTGILCNKFLTKYYVSSLLQTLIHCGFIFFQFTILSNLTFDFFFKNVLFSF